MNYQVILSLDFTFDLPPLALCILAFAVGPGKSGTESISKQNKVQCREFTFLLLRVQKLGDPKPDPG